MSALATITISIICYGTIKPTERTILNNLKYSYQEATVKGSTVFILNKLY